MYFSNPYINTKEGGEIMGNPNHIKPGKPGRADADTLYLKFLNYFNLLLYKSSRSPVVKNCEENLEKQLGKFI